MTTGKRRGERHTCFALGESLALLNARLTLIVGGEDRAHYDALHETLCGRLATPERPPGGPPGARDAPRGTPG